MRKNNLFPLLPAVLTIIAFSGCDPSAPNNAHQAEKWGAVYQYPHLTDADFIEKTRKGVFLIDFDADWCGWCRKMDPHLAAVADRLGNRLTVAKIDFDTNPEARRHFGVDGIPALFVLSDGKLVRHAIGYQDEKQLLALVEDLLDDPKEKPEPEAVP